MVCVKTRANILCIARWEWLILGIVLWIGQGCASQRSTVELDPLTFQARMTTRGIVVDTLDPEVLFGEASKAYRSGGYLVAAEKYEVFLESFPGHSYVTLALFNAGLSRESLHQWKEAIAHFEGYLGRVKEEKERVDGLFRRGICQQHDGQWEASGKTFDELLILRMSILDLAEAWAYRGLAHHRLGQLAEAERAYQRCMEVFRDNAHLEVFKGNGQIAQAQYQIGEIYRGLFEEIELQLPLDQMERDLSDKTSFLIRAQRAYLRAIRLHHPYWAIAAGFQIGSTYEDFYGSLLKAEYPEGFDEEDMALYFDELRKNIRPIIERAIRVYEKNLKLSERSNKVGHEWVPKTEIHLERLKTLLKEDDLRLERRRNEIELEERRPQEPGSPPLDPAGPAKRPNS